MILRKNQDLFNLVKALAGVNQFTSNEVTSLVNFTNRRLTTAYNTSQMWTRYVIGSEKRKIIALTIENASGTGASDVNGDYYLLGTQKSGGSSVAKVGSNIYSKTTSADDGSRIDGTAIYEKFDSNNQWVIDDDAAIDRGSDGSFNIQNAGTTRYAEETHSGHASAPYEVVIWTASNNATGSPTIFQKQAIPYEENNRNTINEFIRIHRNKAFINDSSTEYDFFVDANGANILNNSTTDNVAYVTYKKHIIDTSTGTIITSLDINGSSNLQQIPLEFFNYTAHSVFADFLRLDGQTDKAFAEEQIAQNFLTEELEKVDIINNRNSLNQKFSTYINTSSR